MTSATPKPRAGEHTPDTDAAQDRCASLDWPGKYGYMSEFARELETDRDDLVEALRLMVKAWEQLMPNLKHGVVQDYELVCTTAPVKARLALAKHGR